MRIDRELVEWNRIQKLYSESGIAVPISVKHTFDARWFLTCVERELHKFNVCGAISKEGWSRLEYWCNYEIKADIPVALIEGLNQLINEVQILSKDLRKEKTYTL